MDDFSYLDVPTLPEDPYFSENPYPLLKYYTCKMCGAMVQNKSLHLKFHQSFKLMIDKLRILDKL